MFYNLLAKSIAQFDGAMGTQLQTLVENHDGCLEMLNITRSSDVTAAHSAYVAAGAQVVTTNTLGANRLKLSKYGLGDKVAEINSAAVDCAKHSGMAFVALSIGPIGEFLKPLGTLTFDELYNIYAEQALAGKAAGADLIIIETQTDVEQARIAALAASEKTMLPIIVSITYEQNNRTLMGQPPECAALSLTPHVHAIGINCSGGPEQMLLPLAKMRRVSPLPVVVQPNAGIPHHENNKTVFPYSAEAMAPLMKYIVEAGAAGIGGCCGTTPQHIALMSTISKNAPPAVPDYDGIKRVCSMRSVLPLNDALSTLKEINSATVSGLMDAIYDIAPEETSALLLKLDAFSPNDIVALLPDVLLATSLPLFFAAGDSERIAAALRYYPGCSAVSSSSDCTDILQQYDAFEL